jgi:single-strand DNA-binding protein
VAAATGAENFPLPACSGNSSRSAASALSKFPSPGVARRFAGPSPSAWALPGPVPAVSRDISEGDGSFADKRRKTMFDFARFHILGRVGKIKTFEKNIRVSIAANASYKKDGQWVDESDWNEIVIFDKNTRQYVTENVESGDYVRAQGRLRQNSFKRDGETVYVIELICDEFSRAPKKKAADSAAA